MIKSVVVLMFLSSGWKLEIVMLNQSLAERGAPPLETEREADYNEGDDDAGESEGENVADPVPRHASPRPVGGQ